MKRRTFLHTSATLTTATALGSKAAQAAPPAKTTIAAVGDCILTRKISHLRDTRFRQMVNLLQDADCTWGNCEMVLRQRGEGYPQLKYIDANLMNEPWAADEFAALGIDIMGTANNHSLDYGIDGMFATLRHLDRVGISHAGTGLNLQDATRATFRDTQGGRIAQVNFASTYFRGAEATQEHPFMEARPGLNPLNVAWVTRLNGEDFERFLDIDWRLRDMLGVADYEKLKAGEAPERMQFGMYAMVKSDDLGIYGEIKQDDLDRITAAIAAAGNQADLVLATIHAHEGMNSPQETAPFMRDCAHACLDAGADAFIVAGPHCLRGIEIYQGKPIFYSLGNFIYQFNTIRALPAELMMYKGVPQDTLDMTTYMDTDRYRKNPIYWQTVLPVMTFEQGRLNRMRLYPITLDFEAPLHEQGTPRLAAGDEAQRILEQITRLSDTYNTHFEPEDDSLVWRPSS